MTTKVIFRKFKSTGEIIAFFPEIPGTVNYAEDCLSYMHIGQHGAASLYPDSTIPANKLEYNDLYNELVLIGYEDLKIYKRTSYKDFKIRYDSIKSVLNETIS